MASIGRIVCNNRFLLGVRVRGLASRVLYLVTARIDYDRAEEYDERPVPAQTFTEPEPSGPIRRAAGWECCPTRSTGYCMVRLSRWRKADAKFCAPNSKGFPAGRGR